MFILAIIHEDGTQNDSIYFGVRNNIHIINLEETVPLLTQALSAIREVAAAGGRILFVGIKSLVQKSLLIQPSRVVNTS